MISTVLILLPVFALIFAGYICRRCQVFGPSSATELNRFVVWLALPALLFDIVAHTSWAKIYQPGFFWSFVIAGAVVFIAVFAIQCWNGKPAADASVDAVAASYPNTGYIGFPLLLLVFGQNSQIPTTTATIVVACMFFAVAITLIEIGLQAERQVHKLVFKVGRAVGKNPLIISPLLGALCAGSGVAIPASAETFLRLLGGAASPAALVCLGVFIASQSEAKARPTPHGQVKTVVTIVLAKLALQPALTAILAIRVFSLPTDLSSMAVLLAALPTGTGPFMLAEYYRRDALVTSRVILISTVLSIATLIAIMCMMGVAPL
ncbi:AEC family transporter [Klebsiella variicola subsp. variicola]|uniref:AEC family transporter n=1 Tax=Klebsiella pneumoniae complex TaxID=3390273 RepID=UPI0015C4852C|nr:MULTISPECIES: AEC family transporter [Klebsiella]MCE0162229.1 AEC family transporter [Klebsiella variicola subsp. variicola]NWO50035.1 AEC family transporter [Klebsiella pneumoniae]